ncbi:hypothetical protein [uncultured Tenacibaculum sp.]|uniref:hypothetical protein n=1 Tax=uncultured Tenacibaculum sp. TaxID=174713 RepID=UPI00260A438E|nr:hypothetical protein [uncultured Tenacibaculum sp.]
MNAYEYGIKHFKSKFQPESNCVIFNNLLKIVGDNEEDTLELDDSFLEENSRETFVQVFSTGNNQYKRTENSKRLSVDTVESYLLPNFYAIEVTENIVVENLSSTILKVIAYQEELFVKVAIGTEITEELEVEIIKKENNIPSPAVPKIFAMPNIKLRKIVENNSFSVVFFFTEDGALLEDAYARIKNVAANEIIFFLESDSLFNPLSVVRVKTGKAIQKNINLPYKEIAELAKLFKVKIDTKEVEKVFENHFNNKSLEEINSKISSFYEVDSFIIEGLGEFLSGFLGNPLVIIGTNVIPELKADANRWKYFDKKGERNVDFAPIFPGFEKFLEANEPKVKEGKSLDSELDSLKNDLKNKIDSIPNDGLRDFLNKKLVFVFKMTDEVKDLYNSFSKLLSSKSVFIFLNALFIGIYNSIVDAIAGIIAIIGHILNIPKYLSDDNTLSFKTIIRIGFEMLENAFEAFLLLFSSANLKKISKGLLKVGKELVAFLNNPEAILSKLSDGVDYVATKVDRIGYGIGFAIGFIIEEVITALATGGAKTVSQAFKLTFDGLTKLFSSVRQGAKIVVNSPTKFIQALGELFQQLKKIDVAKIMDVFLDWVKLVVKTSGQLAEEAFERLFKSASAKRKIRKLGYAPTSIKDDVITFCPITR